MSIEMRDQTIDRRFAEAAVGFVIDKADNRAVAAAERCFLDWLGCAIGGSEHPATLAAMNAFASDLRRGPSLVFATHQGASPNVAAFVNGIASHAGELDDIYSPALYHPGVAVIPAALAVAQAEHRSGAALLEAIIVGYEISNRIGAAVNPIHYDFWHTTGTVGTLGAAVAAGKLKRLNTDEMTDALAHAASMAAGLQQAFRSDGMTKPLHAGRAAEGGVLAARLAGGGFKGAADMLAGPVGFGAAMSRDIDWDAALDGIFEEFTIDNVTVKRFAACGHTFAPADAALDLMAEKPADPNEIKTITVRTYGKAIDVAGTTKPATPFEARFSIPFAVAASLHGLDLANAETYDTAYMQRDIRQTMARVSLKKDVDFSHAFPHLRGAAVELTLASGEVRKATINTRKGEPLNPLSDDELEVKFARLIDNSYLHGRADELIAWVRDLRNGAGVNRCDIPGMEGSVILPLANCAR